MANEYDFTLYPGSTFERTIIYKDVNGDPITTIDGAQMQIKATATDAYGSALLVLTNSSGITVTASQGKLEVVITDEQTATLAAGVAVYDLFVSLSDGSKRCLISGDVTIRQEVTEWQS